MMGVRPDEAVSALTDAGVDAIGANCGRGPAEMEAIAEQLARSRVGDVLLVAQSNAGLPQLVGDRFVYDASPDDLAAHARVLSDLGVDLVGGCCGSTPGHIAAMNRALSARA
jgi:5-methyltetrahydrofolate--homocysteine methyltransferase